MNQATSFPAAGDVVGPYVIEEPLGDGGMGMVYRARNQRLGREVALKILRDDLAGDDEFRDRFSAEARAAAQLDHPNIVSIEDVGEDAGRLYIAMRFVRGHDLRGLLKTIGALDRDQACNVAEQVAAALDAAHARGLVHRDVKPANILIAAAGPGQRAGHAYLTDFGIVKDLGRRAPVTSPGVFVGTHAYASPEQIDAKPVDGRADQYSLACVVYECLTGSKLFDRTSDSSVMMAHLLEAPPSATALDRTLPAGVDDVLARALAKNPRDRYPTCAAFAAELRSVLHDARKLTPQPESPAAVAQSPSGIEQTGIRLDGSVEKPAARRGETEVLPGEARRPPEPEMPLERPAPTPKPKAEPPPSTPPTSPAPVRRRRRAPAPRGLIVAGAVAVAGAAVLVAGLLHGGTKTRAAPPPSVTAVADSLSLRNRQQYVLAASRLTRNDHGTGLRLVGIADAGALHGRLTLDRRHQRLVYRPDLGYGGPARFTYTVGDRSGHLAVGSVRLRLHAFPAAVRTLLSYVPPSLRQGCSVVSAPGAAAALTCPTPVGIAKVTAYSSPAGLARAFKSSFGTRAGTCAKPPATGSWSWQATPKRIEGAYGCAGRIGRAVFGWTYVPGRYLARISGSSTSTADSLERWFFRSRLSR